MACYATEIAVISKLAERIDELLDSEGVNFSQGMSALLLTLVKALGIVEDVAASDAQWAQIYCLMPFAALRQSTLGTLELLDEHIRRAAAELKQ